MSDAVALLGPRPSSRSALSIQDPNSLRVVYKFKIEELSLKEEYERLKKYEKKIIDLKSSLAIQSENLKQKALQFQQQKTIKFQKN